MKKLLLLTVAGLISFTIRSLIIAQVKEVYVMKRIESIDQAIQKDLNSLPNQPIIHAMIEKRNLSDFFSTEPQKYVLIKRNAAYTVLAGELDESALKHVSDLLNTYDQIKLDCDEQYHHWFLKNGYKLCPRIELEYTAKNIELPQPKNNFILKNIDAAIFAKCSWRDFISLLYGSSELFLHNGFGVALTDNELVIGEAYAACIGNGFCEVGIVTHPDYRGQGIATQVAAALIKQCLDRQLIPMWSCDSENPASLKVALKLGFVVKRYYAYLKK